MIKSIKVALLAMIGLAFTATAYADFTLIMGRSIHNEPTEGYMTLGDPLKTAALKLVLKTITVALVKSKLKLNQVM